MSAAVASRQSITAMDTTVTPNLPPAADTGAAARAQDSRPPARVYAFGAPSQGTAVAAPPASAGTNRTVALLNSLIDLCNRKPTGVGHGSFEDGDITLEKLLAHINDEKFWKELDDKRHSALYAVRRVDETVLEKQIKPWLTACRPKYNELTSHLASIIDLNFQGLNISYNEQRDLLALLCRLNLLGTIQTITLCLQDRFGPCYCQTGQSCFLLCGWRCVSCTDRPAEIARIFAARISARSARSAVTVTIRE